MIIKNWTLHQKNQNNKLKTVKVKNIDKLKLGIIKLKKIKMQSLLHLFLSSILRLTLIQIQENNQAKDPVLEEAKRRRRKRTGTMKYWIKKKMVLKMKLKGLRDKKYNHQKTKRKKDKTVKLNFPKTFSNKKLLKLLIKTILNLPYLKKKALAIRKYNQKKRKNLILTLTQFKNQLNSKKPKTLSSIIKS